MFCLRLAAMWDRPSPFVVGRMGRRPAKLDEKLWGRRFRLPTLDRARGWQAGGPAPPAFSTLSPLAKLRWPSPADRRFRYVAPGRVPSASSRDSWAASFNGAGMFPSQKWQVIVHTFGAANALQWGRDVSIPEIWKSPQKTRTNHPLQWGRDVSIPEIRTFLVFEVT